METVLIKRDYTAHSAIKIFDPNQEGFKYQSFVSYRKSIGIVIVCANFIGDTEEEANQMAAAFKLGIDQL